MSNEKPRKQKSEFFWQNRIVLVLLVTLVVALLWLAQSIHRAYRDGEFHRERRSGKQVIAPSIQDIEPWMTFDYVNKLFNLPAEYLRETLHIEDSHYPNIQIGNYADRVSADPELFIIAVRNAVRDYRNK